MRFIKKLIRKKRSRSNWHFKRKQQVLESLLSTEALSSTPYILGGTYEWFVGNLLNLDIFFPEHSLAVRVSPECGGSYRPEFNRKFWEATTEEESYLLTSCEKVGVKLLIVTPWDPVDPYSIGLKVKELTSGSN